MDGSLFSDREIRRRCEDENPPLLSGYRDFESQLQPAGFDITVQRITQLTGPARVGGPNDSKVASEAGLDVVGGYYILVPERFYLVYPNEITRFPDDAAGMSVPRSTLLRCGGRLEGGLWDPGFRGRGRLGLTVSGVDRLELAKNAPFAQLIFFHVPGVGKAFKYSCDSDISQTNPHPGRTGTAP